MKLSKLERLSLINQFKILERLYPEEEEYYEQHRKALEEGYTLHYDWMFEWLYEELDEDTCKSVLDILDMYRAIVASSRAIDADDEIRKHNNFTFSGFDGNNESSLMSYVQYVIRDLKRFEEQNTGGYNSFNSHCPMFETYSAMLLRWRKLGSPFDMNKEQLINVLG